MQNLALIEKKLDITMSVLVGTGTWLVFQSILRIVGVVMGMVHDKHPLEEVVWVLVAYEVIALVVSVTVTLCMLVALKVTSWKGVLKASGHIALGFSTMYIVLILIAMAAQFPAEPATFAVVAGLDVFVWGIFFGLSWIMNLPRRSDYARLNYGHRF